MSNMDYLAKMLGYHTKGREAVLREGTDLKHDKNHNGIDDKQEDEPKDNTVRKTEKMAKEDCCKDCGTDKCTCEMKEANGEWKKDSGWKKPEAERKDKFGNTIKTKNVAKSLAKAAAKTSKEMTKEESELEEKRGLWDNIHAKRERIKNGSGERMRKPGAKGAPSAQDIKNSQNEETDLEIYAEHFVEMMEAMAEFEELFNEADLSLAEAIEEWFNDEDLEENFQKMSKTKRLIAAKKAALTKRRTGNWGGGRPSKAPKPAKSIQKGRRVRIRRA